MWSRTTGPKSSSTGPQGWGIGRCREQQTMPRSPALLNMDVVTAVPKLSTRKINAGDYFISILGS